MLAMSVEINPQEGHLGCKPTYTQGQHMSSLLQPSIQSSIRRVGSKGSTTICNQAITRGHETSRHSIISCSRRRILWQARLSVEAVPSPILLSCLSSATASLNNTAQYQSGFLKRCAAGYFGVCRNCRTSLALSGTTWSAKCIHCF